METETVVLLLVLVFAGGVAYYVVTQKPAATAPTASTGSKIEAVGGKLLGTIEAVGGKLLGLGGTVLAKTPPVVIGTAVSHYAVEVTAAAVKGIDSAASAVGHTALSVTSLPVKGVSKLVSGIKSIF